MLQGKESENQLTREQLALYDIHFSSDSFAVMAFYVEDFPHILEDEHGDSDTEALENFKRVQSLISQTISGLLSSVHQGFMIDVEDLLVYLVNFATGHSGENGGAFLTRIAMESRKMLEEQRGIRVLVSAGAVHQTLAGIREAYNEALQAMEFKKVLGIEEIIDYRDLSDLPTGSYYYPLEKEQQLINLIKAGDSDGAKRILAEIFARNFEQAILPLKIARCLMFNLVSTMIKTVNAVSRSGHDHDDFLEELNPVDRLLECESIHSMKQEIFTILETFCIFLKAKHRERSKLKVKSGDALLRDRIINFVKENYTDINLGITFIAGHFSVNPVHLSRIFLEQNFTPFKGIWGSEWVGLSNFIEFFDSYYFWRILKNTLWLSINELIFGFPAPIILALLINELRNRHFTRTVQTITYMPHFVSLVVICGMIKDFTLDTGVINLVLQAFGWKPVTMLNVPGLFVSIYVISNIWQHVGWGSIIYLATLTSIDQQLYEAAKIDGAGHFTILFRIVIPLAMPTIAVMIFYYGVHHWNAWFHAMIFLQQRELFPLQLILREILIQNDTTLMVSNVNTGDEFMIAETVKYAVIVVATLPILMLYPFLQRYFVKGIMIGSLKE